MQGWGGKRMESKEATRQSSYGVISPEQAKSLSGFELLQEILAGKLPRPPISKVMHFEPVEVEQGRVVFSGVPTSDFYNPMGSIHGGYAATLLDSCMGCAIHSTLPAGSGYTTLEFKISFLRALSENSGRVWAEGKVITAGKRVATAESRLYDAQNRLYAHGTTTCLVFPV
jgi:uncharacterized protein (TIGR00369 family)